MPTSLGHSFASHGPLGCFVVSLIRDRLSVPVRTRRNSGHMARHSHLRYPGRVWEQRVNESDMCAFESSNEVMLLSKNRCLPHPRPPRAGPRAESPSLISQLSALVRRCDLCGWVVSSETILYVDIETNDPKGPACNCIIWNLQCQIRSMRGTCARAYNTTCAYGGVPEPLLRTVYFANVDAGRRFVCARRCHWRGARRDRLNAFARPRMEHVIMDVELSLTVNMCECARCGRYLDAICARGGRYMRASRDQAAWRRDAGRPERIGSGVPVPAGRSVDHEYLCE